MKKRLFYLDFVRAIAAISIILIHFNAIYLYAGAEYLNNVVLTTSAFNVYLGNWGVSLFFIISGCSLMYVYGDKFDCKTFYKKRFFSIYPMFWIAYILGFVFLFLVHHGMFMAAPKWTILLTILGFDGYFAGDIPTFYILGEWFLGCIILLYILFPLLRYLIIKYPKITFGTSLIVYFIFILFYQGSFAPAKIIFIRLPEFLFGMYFVKYIKRVNILPLVLSILVLLLNQFIKPTFDGSLQTTYIGIASFLVLVYISDYLNNKYIQKVCKLISKYSYAIFLVHHVIITVVMGYIGLNNVYPIKSYIVFLICLVIIFICAYLLYHLHSYIMRMINSTFMSKQ